MPTRIVIIAILFIGTTLSHASTINFCVNEVSTDCLYQNSLQALEEAEGLKSYSALLSDSAGLAVSIGRNLPVYTYQNLTPSEFFLLESFRKAELAAQFGVNGASELHRINASNIKSVIPAYNYYLLSVLRKQASYNAISHSVLSKILKGAPENIKAEAIIHTATIIPDDKAEHTIQRLYHELSTLNVTDDSKCLYIGDFLSTLFIHGHQDTALALFDDLKTNYSQTLVWPDINAFVSSVLNQELNDSHDVSPYALAYASFFRSLGYINTADPASASESMMLFVQSIEMIVDPVQRSYFYHRAIRTFL